MPITLEYVIPLCQDGYHNAFTSMATWGGWQWLAFRKAQTHGITPPGTIQILYAPIGTRQFTPQGALTLPGHQSDLRDPRLLATPHRLYCFFGAYHPTYPRTELSSDPAENLIRSYVTSTQNGATWTPPTPILRPNYWGWGPLLVTRAAKQHYFLAAYHTGHHGETSMLSLWGGPSPLRLVPTAILYDGAAPLTDDAPHYSPSEPVLFQPLPGILGCLARTEGTMDLGVANPKGQIRWRSTNVMIHPSATISTAQGRLLVGRQQAQATRSTSLSPSPKTALWRLNGGEPELLLTLPSEGDCGYAGIVQDPVSKDRYLISYYTQDRGIRDAQLPEATLMLAQVHVSA